MEDSLHSAYGSIVTVPSTYTHSQQKTRGNHEIANEPNSESEENGSTSNKIRRQGYSRHLKRNLSMCRV